MREGTPPPEAGFMSEHRKRWRDHLPGPGFHPPDPGPATWGVHGGAGPAHSDSFPGTHTGVWEGQAERAARDRHPRAPGSQAGVMTTPHPSLPTLAFQMISQATGGMWCSLPIRALDLGFQSAPGKHQEETSVPTAGSGKLTSSPWGHCDCSHVHTTQET